MKKKICLLLCFWLPLFFSAASFASANMQLSELMQITEASPVHVVRTDSAMSEHCRMAMAGNDSAQDNTPDSAQDSHEGTTSHDKCQQCGFCATLAIYTPVITGDHVVPHHPLSAHIAWVPSSHLSPADQRPPIAN